MEGQLILRTFRKAIWKLTAEQCTENFGAFSPKWDGYLQHTPPLEAQGSTWEKRQRSVRGGR